MHDLKKWPSYRLIGQYPLVEKGQVLPLEGKEKEHHLRNYDSLGAVNRIAEHNFSTSGIALLLSALLALAEAIASK